MPFLQHWFSYNIVEITALMYNSIKQKAMGYINSHCFSDACAILGKQATEQYTTCLHLYSSPYSRAICQYMGIGAQWYLHSSWHQVYLLLYTFICILGPSFSKILHNMLSFPLHMFTYCRGCYTSYKQSIDWLKPSTIIYRDYVPLSCWQIYRRKAIIRTNVDWFSIKKLRTKPIYFNQNIITVINKNAVDIGVCTIAVISFVCISA